MIYALSVQFAFRNALQLFFAILLLVFGVIVAFEGIKKLLDKDTDAETAENFGKSVTV